MKIAIAADLHIGANKFGVSDEKWAEPLDEFVEYCMVNSVDVAAFAGDVWDSRRPTTWASQKVAAAIRQLVVHGIQVLGADGNHDDGIAADSVASSWMLGFEQNSAIRWARKDPELVHLPSVFGESFGDPINVVLLPWVTPQAYDVSDGSLEAQLELTQAVALDTISKMIDPKATTLLIGHAMVSYAGGDKLAPSPGLQWAGKDVVFDYDALARAFNGGVHLGHVHDPDQLGYIGSSQPTDWGDAAQRKSFRVIEITDDGSGTTVNQQTRIYRSSLKLLDVQDWHQAGTNMGFHSSMGGALDFKYDIGRFQLHLKDGEEITPEELVKVRAQMEAACDVVASIDISSERVVAQRVDSKTPLAAMIPTDAVDAWIKQTGVEPKTAKGVRSKFAEVLEHSK